MKKVIFFILLMWLVLGRVFGQDRIDWDQIKAAPGSNYIPRSNVSGDGVWTTINAILSGANSVYGTGSAGLIAEWLNDSTLTFDATGAYQLSVGTDAQRPTGASGLTRYNTTNGNLEYYGASAWEYPVKSAYASGLGTSTRIPFFDANGRITDDADLVFTNGTDGQIELGDITASSATDAGMRFTGNGSYNSGIFTEVNGEVLSLGINVAQVGTRNTARTGGIFRLDVRDAADVDLPGFSVRHFSVGSSTAKRSFIIDYDNGNTYLSPEEGSVKIGAYTQSPTKKLHVQTTTNSDGIFLQSTGNTPNFTIATTGPVNRLTYGVATSAGDYMLGVNQYGGIIRSETTTAGLGFGINNGSGNSYPHLLMEKVNSLSAPVVMIDSISVGIRTASPAYSLDINSTGGMRIPRGTVAQRPTGADYVARGNSDSVAVEAYYNSAWNILADRAWARSTFALAAAGYTGWTLAGDSGSSQAIASGNTATFTGGWGINTAASATDVLTIRADSSEVATQYDITQGQLGFLNGNGTATYVPYYSDANTLTSEAAFVYSYGLDRVTIGTGGSYSLLLDDSFIEIDDNGTGGYSFIDYENLTIADGGTSGGLLTGNSEYIGITTTGAPELEARALGNTSYPVLILSRARDDDADNDRSEGDPVNSGDHLGEVQFEGNRTTSFRSVAARIIATPTQDWASGAAGVKMVFSTTPNSSTTRADRLTIDQDGSATWHATNAQTLHNGTTAQRPTAVNYMLRGNSDTTALEAYYNGAWETLADRDWVRANAGSYTFTNGVEESAGTVKIGGNLTENTVLYGTSTYGFGFSGLTTFDVLVADQWIYGGDGYGGIEGSYTNSPRTYKYGFANTEDGQGYAYLYSQRQSGTGGDIAFGLDSSSVWFGTIYSAILWRLPATQPAVASGAKSTLLQSGNTSTADATWGRIDYGSASGTTDGSGDLTVNCVMPDASYVVKTTVTGTTFYVVTAHTKGSTSFKLRFFDAAGAAQTSASVTVDWALTDN